MIVRQTEAYEVNSLLNITFVRLTGTGGLGTLYVQKCH